MRLSVLDQCPIREGGSAAQALAESAELARAAEGLGYHRFWLAEHHGNAGLACVAPEIVIAHVGAQTSRIRVGSGGVMLTHYASLKVAEQFRTLETLFPGRVDVGVGRAPGSDMHTARALSMGPGSLPLEAYPEQVEDLVHYLEDTIPEDHPFHGIHASPTGSGMPEVWCLGSSTDSAYIAARIGLPFSFAQFISPETGEQAVQVYRDRFVPSRWCREPRISIGVSTICAPTEEEALDLSLSRYCWRFRHGQVPSVETARAFEYSQPELDYIRYHRSQSAIGDPAQVRARLEELATKLTADEVILLTITHDFAARLRSYRLVAEAFGLVEAESTGGAAGASGAEVAG